MRIIKKIGAIALAATMMMSSVMTMSVQASTLDEDRSVTINGRTVVMSASGNQESVTAKTVYTAGTGKISVSLTGYKYYSTNPSYTTTESKKSGTVTAPTGVAVTVTATAPFCLYYMKSVHTCAIDIGTGTYTDEKTISAHINAE